MNVFYLIIYWIPLFLMYFLKFKSDKILHSTWSVKHINEMEQLSTIPCFLKSDYLCLNLSLITQNIIQSYIQIESR